MPTPKPAPKPPTPNQRKGYWGEQTGGTRTVKPINHCSQCGGLSSSNVCSRCRGPL